MEIYFKPLESSDLDNLLPFVEEYYTHDRHPFNPVPIRMALKNLIHHPDWGRGWLICLNTQPIGYVILTLGYSLEYLGRDAFIDEIYIREGNRGQGIGKATFLFLESVCRSLEVQALHLEVNQSNVNARSAYRKWGFVEQDRYLMTHLLSP